MFMHIESDQKKHRADACIIRHIHGIFARATRCYKGDLQLWMEWFQFCKLKKSTNKLSKVLCSTKLNRLVVFAPHKNHFSS